MNFQPKIAQHSRRRFLLAGSAVWLGSTGLGIVLAQAFTETPGARAAPSMTTAISDENGISFRLKALRGRPLLINFWASWCTPCIAEMPSLQKAAQQLQPDGIDVLLVSVDRGGHRMALPVLQSRGLTAPRFGFDPKAALSREMGVSGLPTSFLLSADQQHCLVYVGPREWHEKAMQDEIRHFAQASEAVWKGS